MKITNRYAMCKNCVPAKYFLEQLEINFCSGGLYLITVNVLDAFVKAVDSFQGYFINTEDVFITGMLAEKADISRTWIFWSKRICLRCALFREIVSWSCSIDNLKRRWDEFENKTRYRCK